MPAAAVGADVRDGLPGVTEQAVDQAGLADARRAEKSRGLAGRDQAAHLLQAVAGQVGQGQDPRARRGGLDQPDQFGGVIHQVGLGQDHHRLGAGVPRRRQVALQAADVQVLKGGGDHQHQVEVGGQHHGSGHGVQPGEVGVRADEGALAREHGLDEGLAAACARGDPVAHHRKVGGGGGVAQAAGGLGVDVAGLRVEHETAAVLGGDAGGDEAFGGVRLEGEGQLGGPPERGEIIG